MPRVKTKRPPTHDCSQSTVFHNLFTNTKIMVDKPTRKSLLSRQKKSKERMADLRNQKRAGAGCGVVEFHAKAISTSANQD